MQANAIQYKTERYTNIPQKPLIFIFKMYI